MQCKMPTRRCKEKGEKCCAICGSSANFKYYGVLSCDGCKQFFRRIVVTQLVYECRREGNCNIKQGVKCRSCRLDWCLAAGMDHALVIALERTERVCQFLERLEERKQTALRKFGIPEAEDKRREVTQFVENVPMLGNAVIVRSSLENQKMDKNMQLTDTIRTLAAFEAQLGAFNSQERAFNAGVLEHFQSMEDLLTNGSNMVANFEGITFTFLHPHLPNSPHFKFNKRPDNRVRKPNPLIMECVSVIDLFRTIPYFTQLNAIDRAKLMNYVGLPLVELNARYNSSKRNSPIVISSASGFSPFFIYCCNERFANDQTVQSLANQLYRRSMDKFNQLQMSTEEFLLVRAIMLTHSASEGLSPHAQELLQCEAERYAAILMHYLQSKFGPFAGARRYADILSLAESVFRTGAHHREFFTYLAMVTDQGHFHASTPPAFLPMLLGQ